VLCARFNVHAWKNTSNRRLNETMLFEKDLDYWVHVHVHGGFLPIHLSTQAGIK
jgi:hypothetical protein